jgi:hypothetical protein
MALPVFVNSGAFTSAIGSGTAPAIAYPASIVAGNILIIVLCSKYGAVTTPTGWTLVGTLTAGNGAAASDAGSATINMYYKVADGTETGTITLTIAASTGATASGIMHQVSITAGTTLGVACAVGSLTTPANSISIPMATNPGITTNDLLIFGFAVNSDGFNYSAHAITATGATIGAVAGASEGPATTGQDCELVTGRAACTAGTATANPTLTMTATGTITATAPAGAALIMRLREISSGTTKRPPVINMNQAVNRASNY